MNWAVGIVTAPRKSLYLWETVHSLKAAGWDKFHIYSEPNPSLLPSLHYVTMRPKVYGDWANWFCGLFELVQTNPDADYYAMFEDDVVFCQNTREYVETFIDDLDGFASLSLYTPGLYHKPASRLIHNEQDGHETVSTLTVIMRAAMARQFLADPMNVNHRISGRQPFGKDISNTGKDIVLGLWAKSWGLPIYYHTPSLAQHIGEESTLPPENNGPPKRTAFSFPGVTYNAMDLLQWEPAVLDVRRILI